MSLWTYIGVLILIVCLIIICCTPSKRKPMFSEEEYEVEVRNELITTVSAVGGGIVVFIFLIGVLVLLLHCRRKSNRAATAATKRSKNVTESNSVAPVVITSATHNPSAVTPSHLPYPPQNVSGGVNTAPYPTGGPTGSGYQPFPMPQPSINTGFQSMPQPGYPPYPMHNPVAPYPPEPNTQRVIADPSCPPSYDQVVNADAYQRQDAYNPNFKSQQ